MRVDLLGEIERRPERLDEQLALGREVVPHQRGVDARLARDALTEPRWYPSFEKTAAAAARISVLVSVPPGRGPLRMAPVAMS